MTSKKLTWNFADRLGLFGCVAFLFVTPLWILFPTDYLIREISYEVRGDRVRFVRETPFGAITARWRSEITLLDRDGLECRSGGWQLARYQHVRGNTITYEIGDWAAKCLADGPPYYVTNTRQALLFGVIPLRASVSITEVQSDDDQPFASLPDEHE